MTTQLDAAGFAVAAVLGVIIWLPAMWVAGKRMNWTIPGILGAAFSLAFVATGVAAIIAWLLGASLSLVIALIAVPLCFGISRLLRILPYADRVL